MRFHLHRTWPQAEACSACEQLRKNVVLERNQVSFMMKFVLSPFPVTVKKRKLYRNYLQKDLRILVVTSTGKGNNSTNSCLGTLEPQNLSWELWLFTTPIVWFYIPIKRIPY